MTEDKAFAEGEAQFDSSWLSISLLAWTTPFLEGTKTGPVAV